VTTADPFEAFVLRYQDMVYATAVRLLGNEVEAEDVAQMVFLKAFQKFDAIGESPAAPGWLRTVATNACINHLKRYRARWRFFSELGTTGPEGHDQPYEPVAIASSSPAHDLETTDEQAHLEAALRRLPDHQRVPLVLFHFESASYQDIACRLGVSVAKVKTDIHRGRQALQRLIPGHATT
jgi:RNA polymerase sigma-70 factor (ECF subfamily)